MIEFEVEMCDNDWYRMSSFLRLRYKDGIERTNTLRAENEELPDEDKKYQWISSLASFDLDIGCIKYEYNLGKTYFRFENGEDMLIFQLRWL